MQPPISLLPTALASSLQPKLPTQKPDTFPPCPASLHTQPLHHLPASPAAMQTPSSITPSCSLAHSTFITPAISTDTRVASSPPHNLVAGTGPSHAATTDVRFVTPGMTKCHTPSKIYFVRPSTAKRSEAPLHRHSETRTQSSPGGGQGRPAAEVRSATVTDGGVFTFPTKGEVQPAPPNGGAKPRPSDACTPPNAGGSSSNQQGPPHLPHATITPELISSVQV